MRQLRVGMIKTKIEYKQRVAHPLAFSVAARYAPQDAGLTGDRVCTTSAFDATAAAAKRRPSFSWTPDAMLPSVSSWLTSALKQFAQIAKTAAPCHQPAHRYRRAETTRPIRAPVRELRYRSKTLQKDYRRPATSERKKPGADDRHEYFATMRRHCAACSRPSCGPARSMSRKCRKVRCPVSDSPHETHPVNRPETGGNRRLSGLKVAILPSCAWIVVVQLPAVFQHRR